MQSFFPAVEAHVNTIAAAILSESGMKRLMYIANEMCDEPPSGALLISRCIRYLRTCTYQAIASMRHSCAVCNPAADRMRCRLREVDEVVRVHIRYLTASLVRPGRCVRRCGALREKLFDVFACSVREMSLGDSSDDVVTLAAPRVNRRRNEHARSQSQEQPS